MSNDKKMLSSIGYYYSSFYLSNYSYINLQAIFYHTSTHEIRKNRTNSFGVRVGVEVGVRVEVWVWVSCFEPGFACFSLHYIT